MRGKVCDELDEPSVSEGRLMATALLVLAKDEDVSSTILAFSSIESKLDSVSTDETLPVLTEVDATCSTTPNGALVETG